MQASLAHQMNCPIEVGLWRDADGVEQFEGQLWREHKWLGEQLLQVVVKESNRPRRLVRAEISIVEHVY